MSRQLIVACLALLGSMPTATSATSCAPVTERYFVTCTGALCKTQFRVTQVDAFGLCGRRGRVEEPDHALSEYVASLLNVAKSSKEDGTYVIAFRFRHWRHDKAPTFDAFQRNVLHELFPGKVAGWSLNELPATTVVEMLERHIGPDWITREANTAQDLEAVARQDAMIQVGRNIGLWFVYWVSFLALVAALVHSIHYFFLRLHGDGSEGPKRLLKPILIQAVVLAFASLGIAFVMVTQFWPGLLLVPAVVVIWLAEGWSYYRVRNAT